MILCEDVEEYESVDHLLCHWPRAHEHRLKLLDNQFIEELDTISGISNENIIGHVMEMYW